MVLDAFAGAGAALDAPASFEAPFRGDALDAAAGSGAAAGSMVAGLFLNAAVAVAHSWLPEAKTVERRLLLRGPAALGAARRTPCTPQSTQARWPESAHRAWDRALARADASVRRSSGDAG